MLIVRRPARKLVSPSYMIAGITVIDIDGNPLTGRRTLLFNENNPTNPIIDTISDVNGEVVQTVNGNENDKFIWQVIGEDGEEIFAKSGYRGTPV